MEWIDSHQELGRHPKTLRLARRLKCSVPCAVGHVLMLWWFAQDFAPDGDLSEYTNQDVADACMWEGEPEDFYAALRDSGFIDEDACIEPLCDTSTALTFPRQRTRTT